MEGVALHARPNTSESLLRQALEISWRNGTGEAPEIQAELGVLTGPGPDSS